MFEKIKNYMIDNWGEMTMTHKRLISPSFSIKSCRLGTYIRVYDKEIPIAWIKLCKDNKYNHLIRQEYENLVYVYNKTHSFVQRSIPEPLFLGKTGIYYLKMN